MTTELMILGWTLVLALAQILLVATLRDKETGSAWNVGPRDAAPPPPGRITARLQRAQANLFETLPLFAAAVLIAHAGGREGTLTLWGSYAFLAARVAYVPLYAAGIPMVRSLAWGVSLAGLIMVLVAILK
jgi:uncharacterized MAPEG superfamily protein